MSSKKPLLVVIAGPTAVGKTALCVRLAKALHCDILSADSRQFYKKMAIGTAKPTREEMDGVAHHFIDFLEPEDYYSAGRFEVDVLAKLKDIFVEKQVSILTGGSGLYIQAVCDGMDFFPAPDLAMRDKLYQELDQHGVEPLAEELKMKDPEYFNEVDVENPQRIIRALEICRSTGQPFSQFRKKAMDQRPFSILKIGLERPREELYDRINTRVDMMMEAGLLEEAKSLYPIKALNALQTVGYRELFDYLSSVHDLEEAVRLIKRNTRRYAKRQLTWFKRDEAMTWFSPDDEHEILTFINNKRK